MPIDLRLKLLELTSGRCSLRVKDLGGLPEGVPEDALDALENMGLLKVSDGRLSMNARQRVMLAERLIHSGLDAKRVSRFLGWQEFEDFAESILSENGFVTRRHFVFKPGAGRREIDVLAWNDTFLLAVDCKHWLKGLSSGRMKVAAQAQVERVSALAGRPELLHRLKVPRPEGRDIIPVILSLEELVDRLIDGVPIVCVSKLLSFIYGISPLDNAIERVRIHSDTQSRLA